MNMCMMTTNSSKTLPPDSIYSKEELNTWREDVGVEANTQTQDTSGDSRSFLV